MSGSTEQGGPDANQTGEPNRNLRSPESALPCPEHRLIEKKKWLLAEMGMKA